jgi:hypothetical protein
LLSGESSQSFSARRKRAIDVRVRVGRRNKQRFKLGRRQKNTAIEHSVEEFGKAPRVAFLRGGIIGYRLA